MATTHMESVDSTSLEARRRVSAPRCEREAFVVSAAVQTAGVGRRGRAWVSPMGGVWLTAAWPCGQDAAWYGTLPLAVARVVHGLVVDTLGEGSEERVRIKWPNDVLVDGAKVSGVLCERIEIGGGAWMLVGVGINADFDNSALEGLGRSATTLRAVLGSPVDADQLRRMLSERLLTAGAKFESDGGTGVSEAVESRLAWLGHEVVIDDVAGVLVGLDEDGGVRIAGADGRESVVRSGVLRQAAVEIERESGVR